ncbi:hypothetical protein O181_010000 [Austropuccinia psidii MF-1]|uniref:Uncharacterized protein n=1 Tax=Austropuccinia psidii MF-1 TaxID=1389203 RepID=A0A9Q3BSC3_9BASI|nr:hypothetical protein [Austropuccinia psidii MF-1]
MRLEEHIHAPNSTLFNYSQAFLKQSSEFIKFVAITFIISTIKVLKMGPKTSLGLPFIKPGPLPQLCGRSPPLFLDQAMQSGLTGETPHISALDPLEPKKICY